MPILTDDAIAELIESYFPDASALIVGKLSIYLDLLVKWNARTNLTAIREPEEIVQRHFGESLFAGLHLPEIRSVLDFGSGAGFPGLPIQLVHPQLLVTLGESQNKKAAFLREAVRSMDLTTEVWGDRIERMPPNRQFDLVIMRAVDKMSTAIVAAADRAETYVAVLTTVGASVLIPSFSQETSTALPGSGGKILLLFRRDTAV